MNSLHDGAGEKDPGVLAGDVVVLQPGDERAQKIGKAIASQSANDILHALQERPKTAGDLASALSMPMGTVKYHLENLLDAGLLEVRETRYSVKGRQIKVYGIKDQLLIVAPRVQNIRSILLKYATLFGIIVLASIAGYAMLPIMTAPPGRGGEDLAAFQGEKAVGIMSEPSPAAGVLQQGIAPDPILAFFIGGCLVIVLLLIYEVAVWRKLK
ncbi:MAG: Helix-turn-helix domain protein [Methanoregulaceae archaeon PtaB.Bin056]|jgi:DNA-binding transcriptional ArsR family regulator|nr:MAG: Helix-turn-helix domain protein [Methanoregulaceae archaeon PtaB.Bin056]